MGVRRLWRAARDWWTDDEDVALERHTSYLLRCSVRGVALGAGIGGGLVLGFDRELAEVARGSLVGTGGWAVVWLARQRDRLYPASLPAPPDDTWHEERRDSGLEEAWALARLAPPAAGLTWLVDVADVPAYLVPGMLFGYAVGTTVAWALARRWERAEQAVLVSESGERLYRVGGQGSMTVIPPRGGSVSAAGAASSPMR